MTVATYHAFDGAKRSAAVQSRDTSAVRKNSSFEPSSDSNSFDAMNSTLTGFIILYSRSSVLRFSVSSTDAKQSMTASWCSAA